MPMGATAGDRHTGKGAAASGCLLARDPAEDIFVRHQVEEGLYLDRRVQWMITCSPSAQICREVGRTGVRSRLTKGRTARAMKSSRPR